MEHRMEAWYEELSEMEETEEEFMSNYPPVRPAPTSQIDLSDQAEEIMYRCRLAIGELVTCWDMEYEDTTAAAEEIRLVGMLLEVWYETSPEGVAWQDWRRDEERFHAHKMAERAKAKAEEEEGLEF